MGAVVLHDDRKLAPGWNNAGALAIIAGVIPSGDTFPLMPPTIPGNYDPGELLIRGNGLGHRNGFEMLIWRFSFMTFIGRKYLADTYLAGAWSGPVTLRSELFVGGSLANFNANMFLTTPSQSTPEFGRIPNYEVTFTTLVAL